MNENYRNLINVSMEFVLKFPISIGSVDDLMLNRSQAITWTNNDQVI